MRPDDLSKLVVPSDPRLDPTGTRVMVTVSRPDIEEDVYQRSIWVVDDGGARPFTSGPRDSSPRWSPDGETLAFLRSPDKGKPAQVAVMPVAGGEARTITEFEFGVEALEWSPDSTRIAVVATTPTEEWEDADEDERKRRPRRLRSTPFRYDGMGWLDDRRRHLWLVDPNGGDEPRCLTPGEFDETSPAWSPDGKTIAFGTNRDPRQGLSAGYDVCEVDVETGEVTPTATRGWWSAFSYRPDGALHLLGSASQSYPTLYTLHRREEDGSLTDLTGHVDRSSMSIAGAPPFIVWDGDTAIVGLEDSGEFGLIRVEPDGTVTTVVEGPRVVSGADHAGGRLVFTATSWNSPGELYSNDVETKLTDFNTEELALVEPEHFTVTSEGVELDVWVLLPEGDDPVPLLLNIHGGPASQYGHGFFDEFQVYAAAGYGVVACNPRGSSGKGLDFVQAVAGDGWGVVDLADIRAVVTDVLARYPRLDSERMGLMGGSYGGFLTAWVIAHEDRWKSAIVERALTNFASFAGTSDIAGVFPEMYTGAEYPDWETWWRKSPMAYVSNVTTPTLVLHSDSDFRCPIEQGEQYFLALLRNGTPTEMVRFPGEGHELSRSGTPKHRKERFDIVLDWHGRHLMNVG